MHLSRFARLTFAHLPTPLEFLPRLTEELGGPKIYVKRDDCTGLGFGGNKTRKLEFLMADALAKGADTVVTPGAVQSNHCRQTAAAAAKLGLRAILVFERHFADADEAYRRSGNVLLDKIFGAEITEVDAGTDMNAALEEVGAKVRADGGTPYLIPVGGSNAIGALGYVNCALELVTQANDMGLKIDHILHATGSSGTQAGLVTGLQAMNAGIPVLGIGVVTSGEKHERHVFKLAQETAALLGAPDAVRAEDIVVNGDYVGAAYGVPTPEMQEAVTLAARLEGLLFDPVYSGKALAGMIDLIRKGTYSRDETLVFLHTGGAPGLFGYQSTFEHSNLLIGSKAHDS